MYEIEFDSKSLKQAKKLSRDASVKKVIQSLFDSLENDGTKKSQRSQFSWLRNLKT